MGIPRRPCVEAARKFRPQTVHGCICAPMNAPTAKAVLAGIEEGWKDDGHLPQGPLASAASPDLGDELLVATDGAADVRVSALGGEDTSCDAGIAAAVAAEEQALADASPSSDEEEEYVAGEEVGEESIGMEGGGKAPLEAACAHDVNTAAASVALGEAAASLASSDGEDDTLAVGEEVGEDTLMAQDDGEAAEGTELAAHASTEEVAGRPQSFSEEDDDAGSGSETELLNPANAFAQLLAGSDEVTDHAYVDAVALGEAAIQGVLQSSSSSVCSDDATVAMDEPGEDISDSSSLLALLGAAGDALSEKPLDPALSELEEALLKDLYTQPPGGQRLARAQHLGRWLKTKVGCHVKGLSRTLSTEDAKAMAVRFAKDAGGTEQETLTAWGQWPAPSVETNPSVAQEVTHAEDDSEYFYQPQHRETMPERSILKRRARGRKRPRRKSAGLSVSMPKKKKLLRDVYEVESFRSLDLWFVCPGAEVACDWCLCTAPQSEGRLQGDYSRSLFSQWEFVCNMCLETFGEV